MGRAEYSATLSQIATACGLSLSALVRAAESLGVVGLTGRDRCPGLLLAHLAAEAEHEDATTPSREEPHTLEGWLARIERALDQLEWQKRGGLWICDVVRSSAILGAPGATMVIADQSCARATLPSTARSLSTSPTFFITLEAFSVPNQALGMHRIDSRARCKLVDGKGGDGRVAAPLALARHDEIEVERSEEVEALATHVVVDADESFIEEDQPGGVRRRASIVSCGCRQLRQR